jgi:hypothetical protein
MHTLELSSVLPLVVCDRTKFCFKDAHRDVNETKLFNFSLFDID